MYTLFTSMSALVCVCDIIAGLCDFLVAFVAMKIQANPNSFGKVRVHKLAAYDYKLL